MLAFALALLAHRFGRLDSPIGIVAALVYTVPSIALFQILITSFGISTTTIEIALVGYSLVILYPNIVAGLRAAPPEVLEAARGMGLEPRQVLLRVELPLAVPSIIAGLRIAVVSTVSIATIAAILGGRGLGKPIFDALAAADAVQDRDLRGRRAGRRARAHVRPAARAAPPRARPLDAGGAMSRSGLDASSSTRPTRRRSAARSASSPTTRTSC